MLMGMLPLPGMPFASARPAVDGRVQRVACQYYILLSLLVLRVPVTFCTDMRPVARPKVR